MLYLLKVLSVCLIKRWVEVKKKISQKPVLILFYPGDKRTPSVRRWRSSLCR